VTDDIWAFLFGMVGKEGVLDAIFSMAYGHLRRNFVDRASLRYPLFFCFYDISYPKKIHIFLSSTGSHSCVRAFPLKLSRRSTLARRFSVPQVKEERELVSRSWARMSPANRLCGDSFLPGLHLHLHLHMGL
jgi:hypothetical protein